MPEVITFFRTTGEYDYLLQVFFSDMRGYDSFYKKAGKFSKWVE